MKKIFLVFNDGDLKEVYTKKLPPSMSPKADDTSLTTVEEANYLGKGMFCTAYRGQNGFVYLLIRQFQNDFDYSKEAISQWANDDNKHVPNIQSHGQMVIDGKEFLVFSMPFYEKLTPRHVEAWQVFKTLKKTFDEMRFKGHYGRPLFYYAYENGHLLIDKADIPEIYKDALRTILDSGSNYGNHYGLEISKVNLSVDKDGNLIFRDVLYNAELCYKIRESQRARAGCY